MNWKQIVDGVRSGELRVEYYFPVGKKTGRYRVVRFVLAGGYRDWRRVRVGSAAIYRALRELYPATHGGD
jgi:hypothetical protein